MVLGFSNAANSADTSAPVEVDRIKGKCKGKGKPDQKGQGKSKNDVKEKEKAREGKRAGATVERVMPVGHWQRPKLVFFWNS